MPYTVSTMPQQLGADYTGCVTSLVMIGKSVCPSCQKQHECLEYYCTSEIYRGITLLSASTVDSIYNGFSFIESHLAVPLASEEDTEAAGQRRGFCPGMNPREWKSSGEHCAVCRCTLRENKTSKQGKNICMLVCVFVRFLHTSLTHSNIYPST